MPELLWDNVDWIWWERQCWRRRCRADGRCAYKTGTGVAPPLPPDAPSDAIIGSQLLARLLSAGRHQCVWDYRLFGAGRREGDSQALPADCALAGTTRRRAMPWRRRAWCLPLLGHSTSLAGSLLPGPLTENTLLPNTESCILVIASASPITKRR